jgi:hypothetical protein
MSARSYAGQVGQHIQIRTGGDVAAGDAAFEQSPQGRAALSGEFGEDLGHVPGARSAGHQATASTAFEAWRL